VELGLLRRLGRVGRVEAGVPLEAGGNVLHLTSVLGTEGVGHDRGER
jgi:hypothetical protein